MCNITVPVFDRLLEKDIFTIREAAWLTEGAYKYEEVVRMMGDIVATLHGQIRVCRKQQNSFGAIAEYRSHLLVKYKTVLKALMPITFSSPRAQLEVVYIFGFK